MERFLQSIFFVWKPATSYTSVSYRSKFFPRIPNSPLFLHLTTLLYTTPWQLRRLRSWKSLPVSFNIRQIRTRGTNDNLVNGQNGAPADAPAAGQAAEAEDDSDDDQEEGAPEAGAAGGKLSQSCFSNKAT